MRFTRQDIVLVTFALLFAIQSTIRAEGWKAGASSVVITPDQFMWMSGYAGRNRPAEGKLHDLKAKAIVFEDAKGERVVLLTMDLIGIGRELSNQVCDVLMKKHDLRRSQIALSTTHTHTGPVVGRNLQTMYFLDERNRTLVEGYTDTLLKKLVQVTGEAIKDLEPVSIDHAIGQSTFAVNRRNNREADVPKLRESGQLKGPVDHEVPVMRVRRKDGTIKSIVVGYACHATVLSFYQWTGDWPGFAQIEIEKRHPNATCHLWVGCGADQNPLPRRKVELAEKYGRMLADSVDAVLATKMSPLEGGITSDYQTVRLDFAKLPSLADLENDMKSKNRYIVSRARQLKQKLETVGRLETGYDYPFQTWKLGDINFVLMGGEVTVDYSLRLKERLAGQTVWVAGYTNDVMAYIPSERVLTEGGYEGESSMIYYGLPSKWASGTENRILDAIIDGMK